VQPETSGVFRIGFESYDSCSGSRRRKSIKAQMCSDVIEDATVPDVVREELLHGWFVITRPPRSFSGEIKAEPESGRVAASYLNPLLPIRKGICPKQVPKLRDDSPQNGRPYVRFRRNTALRDASEVEQRCRAAHSEIGLDLHG
jgi:hypothetical protein